LFVAPATGDERNLIRFGLFPIACWRVDDVRFDFDSSVVLPGIRSEIGMLDALIERYTQAALAPESPPAVPVLSLFGHADPVGTDEYNKALSGRRAAAIYAMLTRRVEIWEDLYNNGGAFAQPAAGDQWGTRSVQIMLRTLIGQVAVDGEAGTETRQAVATFQDQSGLPKTGEADAGTRQKLFLAYMDRVCVNPSGQPFQIDPLTGFLASNADAEGKGDFQGCGEFNPVLIFSAELSQLFELAEDATLRNAANAPNRRVMALLFRPGSRVNPALWPCPRAKEGAAACHKRFWSNGEDRRTKRLPDADRQYKNAQDTFACRFYDRISNNSPCDRYVSSRTQPVYFTVCIESLPVWDAAGEGANQTGQLAQGTLVRAVAESYSDDAFFIRFERTDEGVATYYHAPLPSRRAEWICVSRNGQRFAFWSNTSGVALSALKFRDLDDRFSASFLDV
jgi:hypothetical protein